MDGGLPYFSSARVSNGWVAFESADESSSCCLPIAEPNSEESKNKVDNGDATTYLYQSSKDNRNSFTIKNGRSNNKNHVKKDNKNVDDYTGTGMSENSSTKCFDVLKRGWKKDRSICTEESYDINIRQKSHKQNYKDFSHLFDDIAFDSTNTERVFDDGYMFLQNERSNLKVRSANESAKKKNVNENSDLSRVVRIENSESPIPCTTTSKPCLGTNARIVDKMRSIDMEEDVSIKREITTVDRNNKSFKSHISSSSRKNSFDRVELKKEKHIYSKGGSKSLTSEEKLRKDFVKLHVNANNEMENSKEKLFQKINKKKDTALPNNVRKRGVNPNLAEEEKYEVQKVAMNQKLMQPHQSSSFSQKLIWNGSVFKKNHYIQGTKNLLEIKEQSECLAPLTSPKRSTRHHDADSAMRMHFQQKQCHDVESNSEDSSTWKNSVLLSDATLTSNNSKQPQHIELKHGSLTSDTFLSTSDRPRHTRSQWFESELCKDSNEKSFKKKCFENIITDGTYKNSPDTNNRGKKNQRKGGRKGGKRANKERRKIKYVKVKDIFPRKEGKVVYVSSLKSRKEKQGHQQKPMLNGTDEMESIDERKPPFGGKISNYTKAKIKSYEKRNFRFPYSNFRQSFKTTNFSTKSQNCADYDNFENVMTQMKECGKPRFKRNSVHSFCAGKFDQDLQSIDVFYLKCKDDFSSIKERCVTPIQEECASNSFHKKKTGVNFPCSFVLDPDDNKGCINTFHGVCVESDKSEVCVKPCIDASLHFKKKNLDPPCDVSIDSDYSDSSSVKDCTFDCKNSYYKTKGRQSFKSNLRQNRMKKPLQSIKNWVMDRESYAHSISKIKASLEQRVNRSKDGWKPNDDLDHCQTATKTSLFDLTINQHCPGVRNGNAERLRSERPIQYICRNQCITPSIGSDSRFQPWRPETFFSYSELSSEGNRPLEFDIIVHPVKSPRSDLTCSEISSLHDLYLDVEENNFYGMRYEDWENRISNLSDRRVHTSQNSSLIKEHARLNAGIKKDGVCSGSLIDQLSKTSSTSVALHLSSTNPTLKKNLIERAMKFKTDENTVYNKKTNGSQYQLSMKNLKKKRPNAVPNFGLSMNSNEGSSVLLTSDTYGGAMDLGSKVQKKTNQSESSNSMWSVISQSEDNTLFEKDGKLPSISTKTNLKDIQTNFGDNNPMPRHSEVLNSLTASTTSKDLLFCPSSSKISQQVVEDDFDEESWEERRKKINEALERLREKVAAHKVVFIQKVSVSDEKVEISGASFDCTGDMQSTIEKNVKLDKIKF